MLHSLLPAQFVSQNLQTPCRCPECERRFVYQDGVMSLAHYREVYSGKVGQALICFCSTQCLLGWEHPTMLGLMH